MLTPKLTLLIKNIVLVAEQMIERLKTWDLRKSGSIKKNSNLGGKISKKSTQGRYQSFLVLSNFTGFR